MPNFKLRIKVDGYIAVTFYCGIFIALVLLYIFGNNVRMHLNTTLDLLVVGSVFDQFVQVIGLFKVLFDPKYV